MLSEKSQRTQNGTMFVDLDLPLIASRRLSSAELLVLAHRRYKIPRRIPSAYVIDDQIFQRCNITWRLHSTTTVDECERSALRCAWRALV